MASSLRLGLPKKPMAPPPPALDKTIRKKKKRRDTGVGLTEEDLLLGLMDEMGAALKGGVSGVDGVLGQGGVNRIGLLTDRCWFDQSS